MIQRPKGQPGTRKLPWLMVSVVASIFAVWSFLGIPAPAHASIMVSPARIEVEVGEEGAWREITFINKGRRGAYLRFYCGLGSQGARGEPIYLDDPITKRQTKQWVSLGTDSLFLAPGEVFRLPISFSDRPGFVAAYPVFFAEIDFAEKGAPGSMDSGDVKGVARVAIPVLATFKASRGQREVVGEVASLSVRSSETYARSLDEAAPSSGFAGLDLRVVVKNAGNVHGWVRGRVRILDVGGKEVDALLLPEVRMLPGAVREIPLRWTPGRSLEINPLELSLVAEVYGDDWRSSPVPLALNIPAIERRAGSGPKLEVLTAERTGDDRISVRGRWLLGSNRSPDEASAYREAAARDVGGVAGTTDVNEQEDVPAQLPTQSVRIEVRDPVGRPLAETVVPLAKVPGFDDARAFETMIVLEDAKRAASIAAYLIEGEVNRAYAATTLSAPDSESAGAVAQVP